MTEKEAKLSGKKDKIKYVSGVLFTVLYTAYLLVFGGAAKEAARAGLSVCFDVIFTTVFPFSVAAQMLISSGVCAFLGKTAARPLAHLFNLSDGGAGIFLLGLVGGYPTGAAGAAELYSKGELCKSEAEVLISYTNNATPAFMITFIGGLLGSSRTGFICYAVNIFSAVLWAVLVRGKTGTERKDTKVQTEFSFGRSVLSCGKSALNICFFIIIYSVICSALSLIPIPYAAKILPPVIELTSGAVILSGAGLSGRMTAALMCAASSFSGLCVMSQVISVSLHAKISVKYYVCGKIFQTFVSFIAFFIIYPYILS